MENSCQKSDPRVLRDASENDGETKITWQVQLAKQCAVPE